MNNYKISLITAIVLNINIMIGSGIFICPPQLAQIGGYWSFLSWTMGALVFLPVVGALICLSKHHDNKGGLFDFAYKSLGPKAGFFCGWTYFLGFISAQSLQFTILRNTILDLVGPSGAEHYIWLINGAYLGFMAFICSRNIQLIASMQNFFTLIKLSPILFILGALCFAPYLTHIEGASSLTNAQPFSWESLAEGLPMAIFGFWGFEACLNLSHRIRGHKSNGTKAMLISFFLVATIYTLFNWELLRLMGTENLVVKKLEGVVVFLGWTSPGALWLSARLLTTALLFSYANAIFSEIISYSFLLQTMAKRKSLFFHSLLKKENQNTQPVYAVMTNCFTCFIFVTFITDPQILIAISNICILTALIVCHISLGKIARSTGNLKDLTLVVLGSISCTIIGYYSFKSLSSFTHFLFALGLPILGYLLYNIYKMKEASPGQGTLTTSKQSNI